MKIALTCVHPWSLSFELPFAQKQPEDTFSYLWVEEDIEQGVDEAVEVHHHHQDWQVGLFHFQLNRRHEDNVIGSDTNQEGSSDGSHHQADLLLSQEPSFPNAAEN